MRLEPPGTGDAVGVVVTLLSSPSSIFSMRYYTPSPLVFFFMIYFPDIKKLVLKIWLKQYGDGVVNFFVHG